MCAHLKLQNTLPEIDSAELREDSGVWRCDKQHTYDRSIILLYFYTNTQCTHIIMYRWLRTVSEYGVCLLKGVPSTIIGGFEVLDKVLIHIQPSRPPFCPQIARKVSPHLQETFYGGVSEC